MEASHSDEDSNEKEEEEEKSPRNQTGRERIISMTPDKKTSIQEISKQKGKEERNNDNPKISTSLLRQSPLPPPQNPRNNNTHSQPNQHHIRRQLCKPLGVRKSFSLVLLLLVGRTRRR